MEMGLFGFMFLSLLVIITLVVSFRWCCKRMREYDEMMRGLEEEHERRRQVAEDMWIFTIQHDQSPTIRYGDTPSNRTRPVPGNTTTRQQGGAITEMKPCDDLPSYDEAIKLPPIPAKETTSHV